MQAALKPAVFRGHRPPALPLWAVLHLTKDMAAAGAGPRVLSRRERPCAMCVFDVRVAIAWPDVHPKKRYASRLDLAPETILDGAADGSEHCRACWGCCSQSQDLASLAH